MTKKSNEQRAATGVMQFTDDWPGVFIRGDDAMSLAGVLKGKRIRIETVDGLDLERLLRSCKGDRTTRHSKAQHVTFVKS